MAAKRAAAVAAQKEAQAAAGEAGEHEDSI